MTTKTGCHLPIPGDLPNPGPQLIPKAHDRLGFCHVLLTCFVNKVGGFKQ